MIVDKPKPVIVPIKAATIVRSVKNTYCSIEVILLMGEYWDFVEDLLTSIKRSKLKNADVKLLSVQIV